MALPTCRRCGKQDPHRMHGLMSLWFAPLIDLEADLGYFYLCPTCHDEIIVPELERIQNRILELHPAAQRSLEEEWEEQAAADVASGVGADADVPPDGVEEADGSGAEVSQEAQAEEDTAMDEGQDAADPPGSDRDDG